MSIIPSFSPSNDGPGNRRTYPLYTINIKTDEEKRKEALREANKDKLADALLKNLRGAFVIMHFEYQSVSGYITFHGSVIWSMN